MKEGPGELIGDEIGCIVGDETGCIAIPRSSLAGATLTGYRLNICSALVDGPPKSIRNRSSAGLETAVCLVGVGLLVAGFTGDGGVGFISLRGAGPSGFFSFCDKLLNVDDDVDDVAVVAF